MKYKLLTPKKQIPGFLYEVTEDGFLSIGGTPIIPPTDETIVEYDIGEEERALGIRRCYRDESEGLICELVKYVEDVKVYASGAGYKYGKPFNYVSKWNLKELLSPEEVVNGNAPVEGEVQDV